jgi:hypothetical protein
LDPYSPGAYSKLKTNDTLYPGQILGNPSDTAAYGHGYRGEYYLNGHTPSTTLLRLARCSNRSYPTQVRPKAYPGCLDANQSQLVLFYSSASLQPRCLPVPDSLRNRGIASVSPSRDSTQILFLLSGVAQPVYYKLPYDSTYRLYRPLDVRFTHITMAAITFVNSETGAMIPDTLDATEMTDTTDATLSLIFAREAAPPWSVKQVNGHYAVQYLYAYSYLHNATAKQQYSNAALGFRCCSLPRKP